MIHRNKAIIQLTNLKIKVKAVPQNQYSIGEIESIKRHLANLCQNTKVFAE